MRATLLACTLLISVVQPSAQQTSTVHPTVSQILDGMKSEDFSERSKALDEANVLLASGKSTTEASDRVKLGIIRLLIAENARINVPDGEVAKQAETASCGNGSDDCEGDESDYYPNLIATVAAFNDERAIPALAGALPYSSLATEALLRFGDKGLDAMLAQFKTSRNALLRASAMGMVIGLLSRRDDPVSQSRLKELVQTSLADSKPVVRTHAVLEIDCLTNRQDFVPALEKIAKTDPFKLPGKADDGGDGDEFYPVRADARRALRHIQNNQPCGP